MAQNREAFQDEPTLLGLLKSTPAEFEALNLKKPTHDALVAAAKAAHAYLVEGRPLVAAYRWSPLCERLCWRRG